MHTCTHTHIYKHTRIRACTLTHTHIHTHTHRHLHMSIITERTQLNLQPTWTSNKQGPEEGKTAGEWKTWQVYCFRKRNILRLGKTWGQMCQVCWAHSEGNSAIENVCTIIIFRPEEVQTEFLWERKGKRSFHVEGLKTEKVRNQQWKVWDR